MRFSDARLVANDESDAVPKLCELLAWDRARAARWVSNENPFPTNTLNDDKMLVTLRLDECDRRNANFGQAL